MTRMSTPHTLTNTDPMPQLLCEVNLRVCDLYRLICVIVSVLVSIRYRLKVISKLVHVYCSYFNISQVFLIEDYCMDHHESARRGKQPTWVSPMAGHQLTHAE